MAAGVAVNVILNLILIPRYGLNGAALATASADGAILALCAVAIAHLGVHPSLKMLLVPFVAGAGMAVVLWLVGVDRSAFVSIIVGGIVYAGALAALTRLSRDWAGNNPISSFSAPA